LIYFFDAKLVPPPLIDGGHFTQVIPTAAAAGVGRRSIPPASRSPFGVIVVVVIVVVVIVVVVVVIDDDVDGYADDLTHFNDQVNKHGPSQTAPSYPEPARRTGHRHGS